MARYFFHIRDGADYVEDREGADLADLDAARFEAVESAREIVAGCIRSGRILGGKQFEITNISGTLLAVVPFRSVIKL